MHIRTLTCAAIAAITLAPHLAADALTDLRGALRSLAATQPVRGTLRIEQTVNSSGKYANENVNRLATAEVAHDASGVSVTVPQSLIAKGDAAEDAIGSIRVLSVIDALNARNVLVEMLDGATVVEEKRVVFRARPVRQLVLKLNPKPKKNGSTTITIGSVKTDDKLTLWLGDDHLPIAADRVQSTTAGFLFVKGNYSAHLTYSFGRSGDRLVIAQLDATEGGSGMGQKVDRKSTQTLTLR